MKFIEVLARGLTRKMRQCRHWHLKLEVRSITDPQSNVVLSDIYLYSNACSKM